MDVKKISTTNTERLNFCAIKSTNNIGGFNWDYTNSARKVAEAFESSQVFQRYCRENDVNVSYILDSVGGHFKAATLKIEKIIPEKKMGLIDKFLHLFRKKNEQILYVNVFETNTHKAKEKLAAKISSIKKYIELKNFWKEPFAEFNNIPAKEPKWVKEFNKKATIYDFM